MNCPKNSGPQIVTRREMDPIGGRAFKRWAAMLSSIAIYICSAMMGLRCLQIFTDNSIKPINGCVVYFIGTSVLSLFFFGQWKSSAIYVDGLSEKKNLIFVTVDSLSDTILRWSISAIAAFFLLLNLATAMVCVYNLPDKTSRPLSGAIFTLVSTLFICGLTMKLGMKRLQYKRQLPDHIHDTINERSVKESRIKPTEAIQQWISAIAVILVSFGGVLAAYTCMYSLPDKVSRPLIGSLFYLISAIVLGSYIILQWKNEKYFHAYDASNMNQKIIIKEYFSEKLIKWIMAIYATGYTLLSIATAILCIFRTT